MEEGIIKETVKKLAKKDVAELEEKLDRYTPDREAKQRIIERMRDLGLFSLLLPEERGGVGFVPVLAGEILEYIAEKSAGVSFLLWSHYSALLPFLLSGKEALIRHDSIFGCGYVSQDPIYAEKVGGGVKLKGDVNFLWGVPGADAFVVAGEGKEGSCFAIVEDGSSGIRKKEIHERIGLRCCESSSVEFDEVFVPEEKVLFLSKDDFENLLYLSKGFSLCLCGCVALGNAKGAMEIAFNYAKERYQGGDIIINHKIIQAMLGKMLAIIGASECFLKEALKIGKESPESLFLSKAYTTDVCEDVCIDSVQILGGYGYMRDYKVEKHMRDAKMLCCIGGNNTNFLADVVKRNKEKDILRWG